MKSISCPTFSKPSPFADLRALGDRHAHFSTPSQFKRTGRRPVSTRVGCELTLARLSMSHAATGRLFLTA